jgi:hypothetical protein
MEMSEVRLVSHSVCYLCLNSDWLAEALWRWELEAASEHRIQAEPRYKA